MDPFQQATGALELLIHRVWTLRLALTLPRPPPPPPPPSSLLLLPLLATPVGVVLLLQLFL
jgi:hypothetical protein